VANVVVTEDIARADDHETRKRTSVMRRHRYGTTPGCVGGFKQGGDDEWRPPWEVSLDLLNFGGQQISI
jgi:hypothetical protein